MGKYLVILAGLVLLCGSGRADTVYDVTGTLTVTGNNVCGGPCVEVLNFSLEVEWTLSEGEYVLESVPGTMATATSTGPLSGFTGTTFRQPEPGNSLGFNNNFVPFDDPAKDEFDIAVSSGIVDSPIIPNFNAGGIYGCSGSVCSQDFCPPGHCGPVGLFVNGVVQSTVTVIETPELPTYALLPLGLLGLFLLRWGREALGMRNRHALDVDRYSMLGGHGTN